MHGRSWLEINPDIIKGNYLKYKALTGSDTMAVVKADGYGHGGVSVARALTEVGARRFAVATLDEGLALREAGIEGQILVLGYTPPALHEILEKHRLTQAITSEEYASALISVGAKCDTHIAIDTGMRRIGLESEDITYCLEKIKEYSRSLHISGAFTHLYSAVSELASEGQLSIFDNLSEGLISLGIRELHALGSLGGILYKREYLSYIRCGIMLYGLSPADSYTMPDGFSSAISWHSEISRVGLLKRGEGIGYSHSFIATRDTPFAVISTGYADGYRRALSNRGRIMVDGVMCPVIGNICMDQLMVDISECDKVNVGDTATLLSPLYTPDDMARVIGTIGYEVVTGISKRVKRIYV